MVEEEVDGGDIAYDLGREVVEKILVNVLNRNLKHNTIRIKRTIKNRSITVLINSGSTYNFLDFKMASEVNTKISQANPIHVIVANGSKMLSWTKCIDFNWEMQGYTFIADLRLLKVGRL